MKKYPTNKGNFITTFDYFSLIKRYAIPQGYRMKLSKERVGIAIKPQGPKTSMRRVLRPTRGRGDR